MKRAVLVLLACCVCMALTFPAPASAGSFQIQFTFGQEPYGQNVAFCAYEKDGTVYLRSALFPRREIRITDDTLLLSDISRLSGWLDGKNASVLPDSVRLVWESRMYGFRTERTRGDFEGETYTGGSTKEEYCFRVGDLSAMLEQMGRVTAYKTDPDAAAFSRWMNRCRMLLNGTDLSRIITLSLIDNGVSADLALSDEEGTYLTVSVTREGREKAAAVIGYGLSGRTWYTAVDYDASPEETELSWGTYLDQDRAGWLASRNLSAVAYGMLRLENDGDVTTVTDSFSAGNIPGLIGLEGTARQENGFTAGGTAALAGMDEALCSWAVRWSDTDEIGVLQAEEQTDMTWKEALRTMRDGIPGILIWISPFMPADLLMNMINAIP